MRKLAYLLIMLVMSMAAATLLTTNLLASDGESFQRLTSEYQEQQERVDQLTQQVMNLRSLSSVRERAEAMGLER